MTPARRRPIIRLVEEDQPSREVVAAIDAMDDEALRLNLDLETYGEYLRSKLPGYVHGFALSLMPDGPTGAMPGSEEKIQVMRERASRRRNLFHPHDAKFETEGCREKTSVP